MLKIKTQNKHIIFNIFNKSNWEIKEGPLRVEATAGMY